MPKGHFERAHSRRHGLKRCKMRENTGNVVIIDIDVDLDEVIIIDVDGHESLQQKSDGPIVFRDEVISAVNNTVSIDDDNDDDHPGVGLGTSGDIESDAISNKKPAQAPVDSDLGRDATCRPISQVPQLANKGLAHPLQRPGSDAQSSDNLSTGEALNQHENLTIEGGTISISSVYSQELLNNLTQALESVGVDLSQANISVQVDLGKRANMQQNSETLLPQNHENPPPISNQTLIHPRAVNNKDSFDQAKKRMKMKL